MFKGWDKTPYKRRGLLDAAKVVLLGDRNGDLNFMVTNQEEHTCLDVGLCMVELEGFGSEYAVHRREAEVQHELHGKDQLLYAALDSRAAYTLQ